MSTQNLPDRESPIHLSVISDDGYAVPTAVMLTSAKLNKNATSQYVVHCLCNNMSDFGKRKILELDSEDFKIIIQDCEDDKYADIELPPGITLSTMIKCDLAELLPDIDKLLLLDGDLLVKKDLTELWETDIEGKVVAAVNDMIGMSDLKFNELLGVENYFNAGVMLLNLRLMREEQLGQKIIDTKNRAPKSWIYGEQDPFNKVSDGRLVTLPLKWNMTPLNFKHMEHDIQSINKFFGTSYINYTEMEDDAGIIHFNAFKPWRNRLMPYAPLWQKYHDLSPYGNTDLEHMPSYPQLNKITTTRISLLGLPLLTHQENELRSECKLLGFLRLYKIKKRENHRKFYLLGIIPLCAYTWKTEDVK